VNGSLNGRCDRPDHPGHAPGQGGQPGQGGDPLRRALGASFHAVTGIVGQPPTGDLVQIEVAEHGVQLAEAGAVSGLRTRLQRRQIIVKLPSGSHHIPSRRQSQH
jgi:hypothetical protein